MMGAPKGRLHLALINTPFAPTMLQAAGFRIEAQRRIYRIPAGLVLPPVLTTAKKEAG
jgi:hypothetical protein